MIRDCFQSDPDGLDEPVERTGAKAGVVCRHAGAGICPRIYDAIGHDRSAGERFNRPLGAPFQAAPVAAVRRPEGLLCVSCPQDTVPKTRKTWGNCHLWALGRGKRLWKNIFQNPGFRGRLPSLSGECRTMQAVHIPVRRARFVHAAKRSEYPGGRLHRLPGCCARESMEASPLRTSMVGFYGEALLWAIRLHTDRYPYWIPY